MKAIMKMTKYGVNVREMAFPPCEKKIELESKIRKRHKISNSTNFIFIRMFLEKKPFFFYSNAYILKINHNLLNYSILF